MSTPPVRSSRVSSPGQEQHEAREAFGRWLSQQRQVRGIELEEVARATKVGQRYLEALEHGRFELLPAPVFARGFLREYALYVGLDPDEAVNSYLTALQPERVEPPEPRPENGRRGLWLLGVLALLLLSGVAWWLASRSGGAPPEGGAADTSAAASPALAVPDPPLPPAPPRSPVAAPVEEAPLAVTLDFRGNSWVEAEVDGQPSISEERLQGESLTLRAQQSVRLSLDRPQSVDVLVDGRPLLLPRDEDGRVTGYEILVTPAGGATAE